MIICHFILNLRQLQVPGGSRANTQLEVSSLQFVGNAGESLAYEASDVEDHLLEANFDEHSSLDGEQASLDGLSADGVNVGRSVSQDSNDTIV